LEERRAGGEKTGVFTGAYAINPVNGNSIPIWISDYVLEEYGTGAIMAVPAHDQRDFEFARKYNLDIIQVISEDGKQAKLDRAYLGDGVLINSKNYDGESSKNARETIAKDLAEDDLAEFEVNYKLKDWLISRQRYWGAPIPIIYCPKCGVVAEKESNLPVKLPDLDNFKPTKEGRSPLAKVDRFVKTRCPKCGGLAKRETDTMDTFVDSSWYYLRYPNPKLKDKPFDKKKIKKWLPVDKYVGGVEHAVLHLLYARFITKALNKLGFLDFKEPFKSLFNQGMIYRNGSKMSKSVGNVVSPDNLVKKYGRDALRGYELFIGPPEQNKEWNDKDIVGVRNYLEKTFQLINQKELVDKQIKTQEAKINKLIESVEEDLESFRFNTIVSSYMKFSNFLSGQESLSKPVIRKYLIVISIVFPHFAEELWQITGGQSSIFDSSWPKISNIKHILAEYPVVVQVAGQKRGLYMAKPKETIEQIKEKIISIDNINRAIADNQIRDMVIVDRDQNGLPPKLINIII
jgi:leucyl-tRNA synthetase